MSRGKAFSPRVREWYVQVAAGMFALSTGWTVQAVVALVEDATMSAAERWERLVFLPPTVLYSLIPVATYLRGSLRVPKETGLSDYLCPLVMGVTASLCFALLSSSNEFRAAWYFSVCVNALAAVRLVSTRLHFLGRSRDDIDDIRHAEQLTGDLFGAGGVALAAFVVALAIESQAFSFVLGGFDLSAIGAWVLGAVSVFICWLAISQQNDEPDE